MFCTFEDTEILRDEILSVMVAGRDTVCAFRLLISVQRGLSVLTCQIAGTLSFAVYCLEMHPDVLKKLRVEILGIIGAERYPTYDDLRDMKYLRAVINGSYFFVLNDRRCGTADLYPFLIYFFTRDSSTVSSCVSITRRLNCICTYDMLNGISPANSRTSVSATTLPNKIPGGRPWYIPGGTRCV